MANPPASKDSRAHIDPAGWRRLLWSDDHKDIGALYIFFAIFAGCVGFLLSLGLRLQLAYPEMSIFQGLARLLHGADSLDAAKHLYRAFIVVHGVIMIFFMVMPALLSGFGNWFVPLMIGAPNMAFPRLNRICFWLIPASFLALLISLFAGEAAGRFGSTLDFVTASLILAGISAILSSINFIVTIFNMRAPGISLHRMPLFAWSILAASFLQVLALPVLAGVVTMLRVDGHFAALSLGSAGGGDPISLQQIMWLFGYPEIYALILPAFGIISQIVATFTRKPAFGYLSAAYAMTTIGVVGFIVWAHHIHAPDQLDARLYFIFAVMAIAAPAGVMIFSWIAAMWRGGVLWRAPMLWAIGFIFVLTIGGASGAILAAAGARLSPAAYDAGAHFYFTMSLAAVFGVFAGFYYWFPKMSGYMYDEALAKLQFGAMFVGVSVAYFPQHLLGLADAPRGASIDAYAQWSRLASSGAYLSGAGVLIFIYILFDAYAKKRLAGDNPWGATTREWGLPTSSPLLSPQRRFETAL